MGFNDAEPLRARTSCREHAREVQDSFQTVLDALDAARADLYAMEEEYRRTAHPPSRPPSFDHHSEAGGNGGSAHPTPSPSTPPHRRTQGMGPRPELVPVRPQGLLPSVADEPAPGPVRRAPQDAAVKPLWSRGMRPDAVPPPAAATPPATSDGGQTPPEPPAAFPPSLPLQRPEPVLAYEPKGSRGHRRVTDRRHTRVVGVFGLGAVSGLIVASSLLGNGHSAPAVPPASLGQPDLPLPETPAPAVPSPPSGQPGRPTPGNTSLPEIPGTGVLRHGDTGHGVYELQVRLLQIPHAYPGGAINGRFDTEVQQAVARFQKRYGIRGDETGVYGDNTRHALMLRTK